MGEHRPGDGQQAEHVDVEDRANLFVGGLLDAPHQAATGVVDQYVDAAEVRDGRLDRGGDLGRIADVHRDGEQPVLGIRNGVEDGLRIAS